MGQVYVGTSGWYYKDWRNNFYPEGTRQSDMLAYYSGLFPTVEINASFYRLLTTKTVAEWYTRVPKGFHFTVKGSRFITHMKKLRGVEQGLATFFESIAGFGDKIGPILWQLPRMLHKDAVRLDDFLHALPGQYRYAVEFRHTSWLADDVLEVLQKHRASFVWVSSLAMPMRFDVTTDFVFLRFHGLETGARHNYSEMELQPWAQQVVQEAAAGRDIFVYFNNDIGAHAPRNARAFMKMIDPYSIYPKDLGKTALGMPAMSSVAANLAPS